MTVVQWSILLLCLLPVIQKQCHTSFCGVAAVVMRDRPLRSRAGAPTIPMSEHLYDLPLSNNPKRPPRPTPADPTFILGTIKAKTVMAPGLWSDAEVNKAIHDVKIYSYDPPDHLKYVCACAFCNLPGLCSQILTPDFELCFRAHATRVGAGGARPGLWMRTPCIVNIKPHSGDRAPATASCC